MSQKIIDVSYHNGTIDWQKVKEAGYHAIIRVGYGQDVASQEDKQAVRNVSECERLGIPYGLYLYSYADSVKKAHGEALHAIRFVQDHTGTMFAYPCFIDVEEKGLERFAHSAAREFCTCLKLEGILSGVYASENWWLSYLKDFPFMYKRWVAKWSDKTPDVANLSLWQYTDRGTVPGVIGACDISYSYMSVDYPSDEPAEGNTLFSMAHRVISGEYGNGENRKKELGVDYERVQALVNLLTLSNSASLDKVADLVLKGAYGNGETRKQNLGGLYETVQNAANKRLKK